MYISQKLIFSLVGVFMSSAALAVQYTVPDDGWYQLQNLTTYEEVCSSVQDTCDIQGGVYQLINHSVPMSDPKHRQTITVSSGTNPPVTPPVTPPTNAQYSIDTTVVYQDCSTRFPGRPLEDDYQPCLASCPQGYAATGGSCRASLEDSFVDGLDTDSPTGRIVTLRVPTIDIPVQGGYSCDIERQAKYTPLERELITNNFTRTEIKAMAVCSTIVSQ